MPMVHIRSVAVATVALLLVAVGAVPAGAATVATKAAKSYAAGYAAGASPVTSIDATVTLPTFTCASKSDLLSADVATEDADENVSFATVVLACSKKKVPFYGAQFDVDGTYSAASSVTLAAGDTVEMSISCSAATGTSLTIDDMTSHTSADASSSASSTCEAAFAGDEGLLKGKKVAPLPTFGAIDYSAVTMNGSPIGSFDTESTNYDGGKKAVITTGALSAGGTAFTTTQGS